mmetsp:Transcript_19559/g.41177  ORF Transcript_19559/g.41177 Transcript_19559/m.41177 type:complete len:481 (-) Transcript_19559:29-1471(-)
MSQQKPPSSSNSPPSTAKKRRSTSESPIAKRKKHSAKTKSNHDGKHKSSSNHNDGNLKLFHTLSSIEQTDSAAKKSRNLSLKKQYHQSLASNDLTKIHLTLVELRILVQRCFGGLNDINSVGEEKKEEGDGEKLQIELDASLENFLVARRDLLEFQLDGENDGEKAIMKKKKKKENGNDPDYGKLIQRANDILNDRDGEEDESDDDNEKNNNDSNEDSSASVDNNKSNNKICTLSNTLQSEYKTLQSHWKSTLNKHHANLQLSTGAASASGSKFSGGSDGFKAVDVSFWDQVAGSMEHDKFRSVGSSGASTGNGGDNDRTSSSSNVLSSFDDSKLYQQMLKDFIASGTSAASTTATGPGKKSGAGGMALDPAQEAAERLKRAMRKKSGGVGNADVDLTMLLAPTKGASGETATELNLGGGSSSGGNKKKSTVDRRASKGRKIRYVVHPKLVNFTFPVRRAEPMIEEDVWFKSLFGGVGNR